MKSLLIFFLVFFSLNVCAQKEFYNWLRSSNEIVKFSDNGETQITNIDNIKLNDLSVFSISDKYGNLAFYGDNTTIYSNEGEILWQIDNRIVIHFHPNYVAYNVKNKSEFYLMFPTETRFYLGGKPGEYKLHFFTLNVDTKEIVSEKIVNYDNLSSAFFVLKDATGTKYWVCIVKKNSKEAESYLFSDGEIENYVSFTINQELTAFINYDTKISPDQKKIYVSYNEEIREVDFDNSTGKITNQSIFYKYNENKNANNSCFEFSSDGEYIFITDYDNNENAIIQYKYPTLEKIKSFSIGSITVEDMLLGPDGNIYISQKNGYYGVISENQNEYTYNPQALEHKNRLPLDLFPKYIRYLQNFNCINRSCLETEFVYLGFPAKSYQWDFGDNSKKSTEISPKHTYQNAGNYTVTLTVALNDVETKTISKNITVENITAPVPTIICE